MADTEVAGGVLGEGPGEPLRPGHFRRLLEHPHRGLLQPHRLGVAHHRGVEEGKEVEEGGEVGALKAGDHGGGGGGEGPWVVVRDAPCVVEQVEGVLALRLFHEVEGLAHGGHGGGPVHAGEGGVGGGEGRLHPLVLTELVVGGALARQAEGPAPGLVELDGGGRVVGPARQGGDHHPRHLQDHRDEGVQVGDGVPAHLLRLIGRPGTVLLACVSQ